MKTLTPESNDLEQYEFHLAKMIAASFAGHASELQYHWAEVEKIKNRNGGMPPEKE